MAPRDSIGMLDLDFPPVGHPDPEGLKRALVLGSLQFVDLHEDLLHFGLGILDFGNGSAIQKRQSAIRPKFSLCLNILKTDSVFGAFDHPDAGLLDVRPRTSQATSQFDGI